MVHPLWGRGALTRIAILAAASCHHERSEPALGALLHWNRIALDTTAIDHTPPLARESRVFGEQLGPGRSSKALAVVHLAIFEAVNAIAGGYESYVGLPAAPGAVSMEAAIAQAAHDALVALYPSHAPRLAAELALSLGAVRDSAAKDSGGLLGRAAAAATLAMRAGDGADHLEPLYGIGYVASDEPGAWRQDPVSLHPLALGARWSEVRPFVLASASQFRAPPPPPIDSAEYAAAYTEVSSLGGDGIATPTARTDEQTFVATFWAYDGAPGLGTPPRLYSQIAVLIAGLRGSSVADTARLLALVHVAMADTAIAVWESKYVYNYWRPVTGIREADSGTGPTGAGDGNPGTAGDPGFAPLGAPASNGSGPDFTPPFPAYPSGHAGFGSALFQTLRRFYGTDAIPFTFVSDEWNGRTRDSRGDLRPFRPRGFVSLSQAEEENGQSRIYLGIHWSFDKTEGNAIGRGVADLVFDRILRPAGP